MCSIHLNFFERPKNRNILIIGKKGKIYADFNDKVMKIFLEIRKKYINLNFKEMKYLKIKLNILLTRLIKIKIESRFDLLNGIKSLKIAMKLKKN